MSWPEAAIAFLVFGGGFWVLRPIAAALARRIGGEVPAKRPPEQDEEVLSELQRLRGDMEQLAERVDFAERLLSKQNAPRVGPGG